MLNVPGEVAFEDLFEVVTLDSVIGEIKDDSTKRYVDNNLPFTLDVKDSQYFLDRKDTI